VDGTKQQQTEHAPRQFLSDEYTFNFGFASSTLKGHILIANEDRNIYNTTFKSSATGMQQKNGTIIFFKMPAEISTQLFIYL